MVSVSICGSKALCSYGKGDNVNGIRFNFYKDNKIGNREKGRGKIPPLSHPPKADSEPLLFKEGS
jgi:hypothetical protein